MDRTEQQQQQQSESQIENLPESQGPQQPSAEQAEAVKGGVSAGTLTGMCDGSVRTATHTGGVNSSITDGTSNTIMFAEKYV